MDKWEEKTHGGVIMNNKTNINEIAEDKTIFVLDGDKEYVVAITPDGTKSRIDWKDIGSIEDLMAAYEAGESVPRNVKPEKVTEMGR